MGKTKQAKEKKFDRNVEISAPILDPEIIKAIHTPPKGQRLDIKHGGFKALLSDLNSQDSTDELQPLNDNHVPSYIGISCAVSGYSNYSSYTKKPSSQETTKITNNVGSATPNRSRATSPALRPEHHEVHHITIDKNNIHSADEERKELTEKLTASATEHRRTPSPIPPTEGDRHHGAYVGARYCPMPPPSKEVIKHIPLLGIDDEQNPDEVIEEENTVEHKIAGLYGDEFVEDWRESMTHKAKKELTGGEQAQAEQPLKTPKDLVTLKPTPAPVEKPESSHVEVDIPTPNIKVLANVEKQFLNKLLTDENPPKPSQSPLSSPVVTRRIETVTISSSNKSPSPPPESQPSVESAAVEQSQSPAVSPSPSPREANSPAPASPSPPPPMSPDSGKSQSVAEEEVILPASQSGEEHIVYEIRANSPVNNESSPAKEPLEQIAEHEPEPVVQNLVSFSPEPEEVVDHHVVNDDQKALDVEVVTGKPPAGDSNDGRYYLNLLEQEKSFILKQVEQAEAMLENQEAELDEETVGKIRCAIGMANLLINKKCNQFRELCEANINKAADEQFATLNDDLAGFWDMLSIQVGDVRKSFETLSKAKENDNGLRDS